MDKYKLRTEFYLRLYKWAINDAYREASNNFPFLRATNDFHIAHTLQILESLPESERIKIFVILTKLSYRKLDIFANTDYIELTSEENYLLEVFQQKEKLLPITTNKYYELYMNNRFLKIPVKKTKPLVMQELNPLMDCEQDNGSYITYRKIIDKQWVISTLVVIERLNISYYHIICILPLNINIASEACASEEERFNKRLCFSDFISLYRWLGCGSITRWLFYKEEDPMIAAKTLAKACTLFIDTVPNLVDGMI